jgi:hypothetical protein
MNDPKQDLTPEESARALVEALHGLVEHAATIAHARRAFYEAYIAEGFTPTEALELCKDLSSL